MERVHVRNPDQEHATTQFPAMEEQLAKGMVKRLVIAQLQVISHNAMEKHNDIYLYNSRPWYTKQQS